MTKALVLSGGGPVGIAWQTGLTVGLASGGVDLAEADFILGTSAGSVVGAQIALGRDLNQAMERYNQGAAGEREPRAERTASQPGGMAGRMQKLMEIMAEAATSEAPPEETRAAIGKFALEADTPPEEAFIAGFGHLNGAGWPPRYACTAVDAVTGEFVVWDGAKDVELARAVASSCAVPGVFPPITIDGRRYIDGGMRSGTSADLAVGHDRVLVLSLLSAARMGAADPRFERMRMRSEEEQAKLREAGATVENLVPDDEAAAVMGMNLMDSSLAPAGAENGLRQGKLEAERLRAFWR